MTTSKDFHRDTKSEKVPVFDCTWELCKNTKQLPATWAESAVYYRLHYFLERQWNRNTEVCHPVFFFS